MLGVGGMGAVFEGVHQTVGRQVAIKILFPEDEDEFERLRFSIGWRFTSLGYRPNKKTRCRL